ncbi:MAG: hypothetical protein ABI904_04520 [Chloroflexota bacterium]
MSKTNIPIEGSGASEFIKVFQSYYKPILLDWRIASAEEINTLIAAVKNTDDAELVKERMRQFIAELRNIIFELQNEYKMLETIMESSRSFESILNEQVLQVETELQSIEHQLLQQTKNKKPNE